MGASTSVAKLPSSSELDALVAERAMGWANAGTGDGPGWWDTQGHLMERYIGHWRWSPSTDIHDAWRVVERMHELGHKDFGVLRFAEGDDAEPWIAGATRPSDVVAWFEAILYDSRGEIAVRAATAPLAICRAALQAVR